MNTGGRLSSSQTRSRTVETEVKPRTQHLRREIFSKAEFGK